MITFYEKLPTSIEVGNEVFEIVTDFREWIRFIDIIKSKELDAPQKLYYALNLLRDSEREFDLTLMESILDEIIKFFKLGEEDSSESSTECSRETAFDFNVDFGAILSDFQREYNIDLLNIDYLHWWQFKLLFDNLSEKSEIKTKMYYRTLDVKTIKDKDERKRILKIKRKLAIHSDIELTDAYIGNAFL